MKDILMALLLRIRDRLLARLQLSRQGELRYDIDGNQTLDEGLERDAERLSEDAAAAIWTFACVKTSMGLKTVPLLEACCSILCQNPTQLREHEQAKMNNANTCIKYEVDDAVDRLPNHHQRVRSIPAWMKLTVVLMNRHHLHQMIAMPCCIGCHPVKCVEQCGPSHCMVKQTALNRPSK